MALNWDPVPATPDPARPVPGLVRPASGPVPGPVLDQSQDQTAGPETIPKKPGLVPGPVLGPVPDRSQDRFWLTTSNLKQQNQGPRTSPRTGPRRTGPRTGPGTGRTGPENPLFVGSGVSPRDYH